MKARHHLDMRMSDKEFEEIREAADAAGLTRSAYCRRRILGHAVVAKQDLAVLRELRRIGGLIKHLYSQGARSEAQNQAWEELKKCFQEVAKRQFS